MTFLVPFDASELAEAALVRADEYAEALDEDVTVVTVVPESKRYAREKGWIAAGEAFDVREVIADVHREVTKLSPEASFRSTRVDGAASEGTVASTIRSAAKEVDASVVFLGSEDAGRVVVPIASVGGTVAADSGYDVHLVRRRVPPKIEAIRYKSDFYPTD